MLYKHYNRLKSIYLPRFHKRGGQLRKLLITRFSYRKFSAQPFEIKTLSEILFYSAGIVRKSAGQLRRPYPSAGAKYPLEIYPLVIFGKDIEEGLYHYDPSRHALDVLLSPIKQEELVHIWMGQQWFRKAAVVLIITAVFERTTEKYGKKGLPFPFIEAGHMGQNIYLLAQSMGVGCCAIGQFNEKELIKLLDINPFNEFPVYYIALGN